MNNSQLSYKLSAMRRSSAKLILICLILFSFAYVSAQSTYTPYDNLPDINKLEKPSYSEDYPSWAKKLYQYPINFNEICEEFDDYMANTEIHKNAIIRYFINWKIAVEPYVLEDGTIEIPDLKELFKNNRATLLNYKLHKKSTASNNSNWTFWGPKETVWRATGKNPDQAGKEAPWQVNVYSLDVAESNNDILYCGTETGFVNKTVDKGLTWQICGQDYHFGGGVSAIAIHPANPDIVYVSSGSQIHKTIDGGVSWAPMLSENNIFSAMRLRIDANNHHKIIAATDKGIFISLDDGVSWTNKWSKRTWDIEIKPDNSDIIYGISSSKGDLFELVISKDGGSTFSKDSNFPTTLTNTSGGLIAVTPTNPNILYVSMLVAENSDKYAYIYKGTYNETAWNWDLKIKGPPRSEAGLGGFSTGQGYFDFVLAASPEDENTVFWGTCSLFKSTDGAVTFEKIGGYGGDFNIHPDIQDIKLLGSGKMWVSTDGGMNYSTDYFVEQENYHPRIKNIVGSGMWGFDMGWNQDIIVGGRYHNGNTAIADFYGEKALRMGGAEAPTGWIVHGKKNQAVFSDINKGYTTSIPASIDEIVDNKKYIFSKLPNMKSYGGRRGNLLHHPNYHSIIYVGEGTGFWKSSDMGATFDLLNNFAGDVMFIQNSYKNPDVIYTDVEGKGLYRSEDGGETWIYKPSLTNDYGIPDWAGHIHFVISPYDENTIYATPQKTKVSWDAKVFKSTDGGTTWVDWSGSISKSEFSKCLVIQPTKTNEDLVYLFIPSQKNMADAIAKVFYRKEGMTDWELYNNNYPASMTTIMALPFYRNSKIRVAGKGGVWESPFAETDFTPIITPWIDVPVSKCMFDTLFLDDHSMLNHDGASWKWTIDPAPQYISDANIRNPMIVLGDTGSYNVTLEVTKNGTVYSKTINNMFSCTTCPSVDNCSNPAELNKDEWSLIYVDSQEPNRLATNAFDGDNSTFWHTEWKVTQPTHPHEIQIDLGRKYYIHQLGIVNRPTGTNGRIRDYKLYLSDSKTNWGEPINSGTFENVSVPQPIKFINTPSGQFLKIVALSEVNDKFFTTIAEINIIGCYNNGDGIASHRITKDIKAFPIPTNGIVNLSVPVNKNLNYSIYLSTGQVVQRGKINRTESLYSFDLTQLKTGIYFIIMIDEAGVEYRAKVVKR